VRERDNKQASHTYRMSEGDKIFGEKEGKERGEAPEKEGGPCAPPGVREGLPSEMGESPRLQRESYSLLWVPRTLLPVPTD